MTDQPRSVSREDIEQLIGQSIGDPALYLKALRHGSLFRAATDSHLHSNERLEFLGDGIVNFIVAEAIYERFPNRDEGFMTRLRSRIVNGPSLARFGQFLGLDRLIMMSEDTERTGGRANPTIVADAFEAVIAAVYLDLGYMAARSFIRRSVLEQINMDELAHRRDNYKSILLELAQARGWPQPTYRVIAQQGPPHEREFTVEVLLEDRPAGQGHASSKKRAEQQAARRALEALQDLLE